MQASNDTVKTRNLEPAFFQVSLKRFLHKGNQHKFRLCWFSNVILIF